MVLENIVIGFRSYGVILAICLIINQCLYLILIFVSFP